jgi:hypothetical protein
LSRKARFNRRANCAAADRTKLGSGVPKVGAPDCIDSADENSPNTTGAPGRINCVRAMPAMASAKAWASVPAALTGAMAPCMMNGVTITAWLARA